MLRRHWAFRKL